MSPPVDRRGALRLAAGAAAWSASCCSCASTAHTSPTSSRRSERSTTGPARSDDPTTTAPTTTSSSAQTTGTTTSTTSAAPPKGDPAQIEARFGGVVPTQWGTAVTGVGTRLATSDPVMALTFDACGGPQGSGFDLALIDLMVREQLPATLFLNGRWIDANPLGLQLLLANPLFEIANHGTHHRPLSVDGHSAYGIAGCASVAEVIDEVGTNHDRLAALVGRAPRFFRSGTAHYDEVAAQVVTALGETPVSFAVNGDAGATFTAPEVASALSVPLAGSGGSVVLLHMNQPTGSTAVGLAAALPGLRLRGIRFVTLSGPGVPVVAA